LQGLWRLPGLRGLPRLRRLQRLSMHNRLNRGCTETYGTLELATRARTVTS
jgi:hypothetical protein